MNTKPKKKLRKRTVVLLIILAAVLILVIPSLGSLAAMASMSQDETGVVMDDVYTIKNGMVNMHLVKGDGGYVAFDASMGAGAVKSALDGFGIAPSEVVAVFMTHTDADHTGALPLFSEAEIHMAQSNVVFLGESAGQSRSGGFLRSGLSYGGLADGEIVEIAGLEIKCIFTPGHTPGSASYIVNDSYLFSGDNLSLNGGRAELFLAVYNMDDGVQEQSIKKLATIQAATGLDGVFTSHHGHSTDVNRVFSGWA